jgi:hypothetical protein
MSTATLTQAQDKGLRHQFAAMSSAALDFCHKLYAAHGGNTGKPAAQGRDKRISARELLSLADRFEGYSPSLSAELRNLASRG